jgi:hypothetical protein
VDGLSEGAIDGISDGTTVVTAFGITDVPA